MTGIGIGRGLGFPNPRRGMMAPDVLAYNISSIAGAKVASLIIGDDFTGIGSWKARIGADCASAGAVQAAVGMIGGRKAAVFSAGASSMGYTVPVNVAEYWVVAKCDWVGNFDSLRSLVGGAGSGPRLVGLTGATNLINDCTITRDGASSVAVDSSVHVWRATDPAAADARHLGNYGLGAANNWVGPIGLCMAVTTSLTADEASQILTLVNRYFKI